jgi:ATP-dependent DNA helicase DinG
MLERKVVAFFAAGGPLASSFPEFESRPEQQSLAREIAHTLSSRTKLIAEAGTGIGKTLAYLAPAVISGLKVVISTGTKNLQEQILAKDLPILERALAGPVDAQVMKGRANYLCLYRADRFARQPLLPSAADIGLYQTLVNWRQTTDTGDRAEVPDLPDDSTLWRELSASSEQCLGRKCAVYERCFVTQMRRRAQAATIVVVNHHLYLSDLSLRQRVGDPAMLLLPPHDLAIFDEAHELDEVAAQHFGLQVSERRVEELCRDALKAAAEPELLDRLRPILDAVRRRAGELYDTLPFGDGRMALPAVKDDERVRIAFAAADEALEALESLLSSSAFTEAPALARRAAAVAAETAFLLDLPPRASLVEEVPLMLREAKEDFVRFSDRSPRNRTLVARPIDVASLLAVALEPVAAVFVSATLTVGGSFAHFRARLGLTDAAELAVGSPFDFEHNARLYLPTDLPDPDHPDFAELASARAAALVDASGGGAFILCTSYRMLPIMRAAIERDTSHAVLMQGEAPRTQLIEQFREHGHGVLVATMSFWQGVDVPGSALRLVIIDKLPFASPGDPVLAARLDYLRQHGQDPFHTYQVPQAALLLRQGFGRLIRRKSDRGLVAILDKRIVTRGYGKVFVKSLPACPRLDGLAEARAFLANLA